MGAEQGEYDKFFSALTDGRARLSMLLEPQTSLTAAPGPARQFGANLKERFFGFAVQDATPILWDLRQIKTPYEQAVMRKSLAISNEAHKAGMREAAPGKFEYEVEAAIEHVYLRNGAMSWGYPSIVGSGPNATILHYNKSSRRMERGDLLLVDAAANYQGYTGDITRTYPVGGTFTPAQRDIYEIVLAAQEAGIAAAKAGNRFTDIQAACDEVLRAGLVRLGLVTDAKGQQFKIWSTHGVSHWIGMEVHDVAVPRPLGPGMAFVIEPGIYIREAALDNLPKTPENAAFIEKVRPMVQKYRNIGVRIEDSFLLTEAGLERLSSGRAANDRGDRTVHGGQEVARATIRLAGPYLSGSPAARRAFRSASSASSTSFLAASCARASLAFLSASIALSTAHCSAMDVAATVIPSAFENAAYPRTSSGVTMSRNSWCVIPPYGTAPRRASFAEQRPDVDLRAPRRRRGTRGGRCASEARGA